MKRLIGFTAAGLIVLSLVPSTVFAAYGEYNFQDVDYHVVVDAWDGYVNFRSGPGLAYGIICPIYNGEDLYVSMTADNSQDGLWWGHINYYGDSGWISLSEVSFIEDSHGSCDYDSGDDFGYDDDWDVFYWDDGPLFCPYDIHTSIMYNNLTFDQQTLFNDLYDAVYEGDDIVYVPSGMTTEDVFLMMDMLQNEAPELCAFDKDASQVWGSDFNGTWRPTEVHLSYRMSVDEQYWFISEMQSLAYNFSGMNAVDGIASIHDYLITRFEFGYPAWGNAYLAYSAMENNICVCNAYAECAAMLCHFAGYSCSYIDGETLDDWGNNSGRHAWNIGYANGSYFYFDPTWDDCGYWVDRTWFGWGDYSSFTRHIADSEYCVLPWANGLY